MFTAKVFRTILISPFLGVLSLFFLLGLLICIISEEYGRLYAECWKRTIKEGPEL